MVKHHRSEPGVERVPVSQIHLDSAAWPRWSLSRPRVEEFLTLLLDEGPSAFPLIEVVADGSGGYFVADGRHRLEAILQTDLDEALAVVLDVPYGADPRQVAFERGLVTSSKSSLPLTRAEKHAAIRHLKATRPELSNHKIAGLVACSHQTVARVLERSKGPEKDGPGTPLPPTDLEVATRLLRAIERIYQARGLGVWDKLTGDHTGERLAHALHQAYGDDALRFAERVRIWVDDAIGRLGGRP